MAEGFRSASSGREVPQGAALKRPVSEAKAVGMGRPRGPGYFRGARRDKSLPE